MKMKQVFSSHISAVGYENGELAVQFQSGKIAVYSDVPSDIAQQVVDAPSVGTALNALVKGKFAFGYKPR